MAKRKYGKKHITGKMRLAFPHLFTPQKTNNGSLEFSCALLADPKDPAQKADLKKLKANCQAVAMEAFGTLDGVKLPFKDGSLKSQYDGYAGMIVMNAHTTRRVGVVGEDPNIPITMESDVYSGCYVRASLVPASYPDMGNGAGVTLYLGNVQKVADGERFGGGAAEPSDEFSTVEESSTDDDTSYDEEDMLGF